MMNCIVTAGPTYEPLDDVRRLTNVSTGRLGSELAMYLAGQGHRVTLLLGYYSTWRGSTKSLRVENFTTTADLKSRLGALAGSDTGAIFHAAAVSDFTFGNIWERNDRGDLTMCAERKVSTRKGRLLAELQPTPKIISELRGWFPTARLVGWKYELDGDRQRVMVLASDQIRENRTDVCVVNGTAYGAGFGLVSRDGGCEHLADRPALYAALARLLQT